MTNHTSKPGRYEMGDLSVNRMGYGAMQLAGPGVFGPPKDRTEAIAVLRAAIESGVDHIDTADYYGPYVTNQLIREALHPYPKELVIVTKLGGKRGAEGSWQRALTAQELTSGVHDNLRNLGVEALDVVNLRVMFDPLKTAEGPIEEPLSAMLSLQKQGLIRHIGLSNATPTQVEFARRMGKIVCVQNLYNIAHRDDDALIDALAATGIAYVPFFPLGGFTSLQSAELSEVAAQMNATPMQVALAWLLKRSPNILLIPGTSSLKHLQENLQAGSLELTRDALLALDRFAPSNLH